VTQEASKEINMRCILIGIAVWSLLTLAACVEDEAPTFVVTNAIPLDDDCVATAGEEIVRSRGRYDVFCASTYEVPFEVWTYMISRHDPEKPRSETNIAQFETAEVQLMTPDGAIIVPTFSTVVGGTVVPGDGNDPGKSVVRVDVIPAAAVTLLPSPNEYPMIVAEIQLFGKTNGDVEIESGMFRFPIELCDGCYARIISECRWTADWLKALTDAEGCQRGYGYDGDYCWCNGSATSTTSQCEYCPGP